MDNVRTTWNDAAEKLGGLGSKLKVHYEQQQEADRQTAQADVQTAAKRLGDAVQDAFEAMGAAAKDDAVKADVKQVGLALTEALKATFSEISGEVRGVLKRPTEGDSARPEPLLPVAEEGDAPRVEGSREPPPANPSS